MVVVVSEHLSTLYSSNVKETFFYGRCVWVMGVAQMGMRTKHRLLGHATSLYVFTADSPGTEMFRIVFVLYALIDL